MASFMNFWTEGRIFAVCGTENAHPLPWEHRAKSEERERDPKRTGSESAKTEWQVGYWRVGILKDEGGRYGWESGLRAGCLDRALYDSSPCR